MSEQSGAPERGQMRASNTDRERVAHILQTAMTDGRISPGELEQRLDTVYAAKTLGELEPVTADLPGTETGAIMPATSPAPRAVSNRIGGTPGSTTSIAIMSGASRKGSWVLPPQHNSFAFWGGVEIDLRDARFAQRQCTITAVAMMGGIEITVPDDVLVDVSGIGFMGAFDSQTKGRTREPSQDAPVVRVNGFAFWGAVMVTRKPRSAGEDKYLDTGSDSS